MSEQEVGIPELLAAIGELEMIRRTHERMIVNQVCPSCQKPQSDTNTINVEPKDSPS